MATMIAFVLQCSFTVAFLRDVLTSLEENLKSELTLDQRQKKEKLKAETMNTIINYTTDKTAITERLTTI